jgi:hypothetical protein
MSGSFPSSGIAAFGSMSIAMWLSESSPAESFDGLLAMISRSVAAAKQNVRINCYDEVQGVLSLMSVKRGGQKLPTHLYTAEAQPPNKTLQTGSHHALQGHDLIEHNGCRTLKLLACIGR